MSEESERHLSEILRASSAWIEQKYREGNAEHGGGNLTDMSAEQLVDEAINEAVDQMVFLLTLKQKFRGHSTR